MAEEYRVCNTCGEKKPLDAFARQPRLKLGRSYHCRACQRVKNVAFYHANREREKARAKAHRAANPEQHKNSTMAWRAANKERHAAMKRAYRAANPEKVKAARRASYEANRERDLAVQAEYKRARKAELAAKSAQRLRENPGQNRYFRSLRRAAEKRALPAWADRREMKRLYLWAAEATLLTGVMHHVDHIVPLKSPVVSGLHWEGNLRIIPGAENQSKSNRHWPDMP